MVSRDNRRLISIILAVVAMTVMALMVTAQSNEPTGPDSLNVQSNERFNATGPLNTSAQAGNVTELTIVGQSPTRSWQGYFGNISGTITLEDATGNVFYNWTSAEPEGEIYASTNNSITWSTVGCFNFTNATNNGGSINLTTEEARYGIPTDADDGIDETYSQNNHDTFYIGTNQITGCQTTYAYTQNQGQTSDWQNVLLSDSSTDSLIFTTLIENRNPNNATDPTGFNGGQYDFQMLVAEDEHDQAAAGPTTYYFWVEIE